MNLYKIFTLVWDDRQHNSKHDSDSVFLIILTINRGNFLFHTVPHFKLTGQQNKYRHAREAKQLSLGVCCWSGSWSDGKKRTVLELDRNQARLQWGSKGTDDPVLMTREAIQSTPMFNFEVKEGVYL